MGWLADDETAEAVGLSWGAPDVRRLVDRHWSRAMMLLLAPFGVTEPSAEVTFTDTARGRRRAAALWGPHPRVLVVPGSRSADKRWSSDAFVEVLERAGAGSVVVAGAPSERALAEGVAARVSGKVYCGKDLAALVALIRGADAVLANDTGPMHLAFLCNRPCVAIFTQMSPVSWGPLDPGPHRVVQTTGADGEIDQVAAALAELLGSAVEG